ncbi:chromosomal replication initiator protein DnaA [Candidatus Roizmanbacteria bacterium]|nr:MAG: chromosomal replication initiator protein DnaA [Candidatus Roizmanbacteria bacterium]
MLSSFWDSFLESISEKKEKNPIFFSILKDAQPVEIKGDILVLSCSSNGAKSYLDKKKEEIEDLVSFKAGKKTSVEIVIQEKKLDGTAPLLDFQPSKEDIYRKSGLNINYNFENFAVSPTNQIAFAAAQSVAKSPGVSYNPLFFYGGVGVGKTHLAQSIAKVILDQDSENNVYFCSSEKFMNELIESIRAKTTARFRKKYRSLNLIIVDDIQFLAGKQTVQEEFFHTFNSIVSAGGQVVLTSDRPPFEIRNLEDRLRSRFSGGLIVDIQQPDFELRTAILLIKAREKNIAIDMEAAKIIAETVLDTRSLEGTLLSLYARTLTSNLNRIDLSVVEDFFHAKTEHVKKRMSPQDVIKTVCSFYNIKQSHIKGATRKSTIALARQIVMYLLRTELDLNLEEVAYLVKRKDHTTVIHAINKVRERSMKDDSFRHEIEMITKSLQSST